MKINNLNGLRAIAAIGILMMHYYVNIHMVPDYGVITTNVIPWFTNFIFLFFMVSAFGMYCGYFHKVKVGLSPDSFYPRRYARILPFFAFLSIVDIVVSFSPQSLAEAFTNITLTNGLLPYNHSIKVIGVGWFLGVIFVYYMMFPFFVFITANRRRTWASLIISGILCALGLSYFFTSDFVPMLERISPRTSLFCTAVFLVGGALIFHYKDEIYKFIGKFGKIVGPAVIVVMAIYLCLFHTDNELIYWLTIFFASAAMLIACIGPDSKWMNNKLFNLLGKYSFEIYLCHMFIFRVMEKAGLIDIIANPQINYAVVVVAGLIGATVFSIAFNRVWDVLKDKLLPPPTTQQSEYLIFTYAI